MAADQGLQAGLQTRMNRLASRNEQAEGMRTGSGDPFILNPATCEAWIFIMSSMALL